MIKKVTEYSIANRYDNTVLVFVDAKLLLESFKDKGLWPRLVAYMDAVAPDSHVNSGIVNVNEGDCDSFHYMCINTGIDGSEYKTWVNVEANVRSCPSRGYILVESGYIMCIPYNDIKDHLFGSGLSFVSVASPFNGYCGVSYKTGGMFDNIPTAYIEVGNSDEMFYKIDCSHPVYTAEEYKKIFGKK